MTSVNPGFNSLGKTKYSLKAMKANGAKTAATKALPTAQKVTTFTRAYGGQSIFDRGFVPSQRTISPYDTVSLRGIRQAGLRAEVNNYNIRTGNGFSFIPVNNNAQQVNNGMDTFTKIMLGMQVAKQAGESVFATLNAIQDLKKSNSSGGTGGASSIPTAKSVSSDLKSVVSNMTSAKDSASLNAAITNAKAELSKLESAIPEYESAKNDAESKLEGLKQTRDEKAKAWTAAEDDLKTAQNDYKKANKNVEDAKTARDSARSTFEKMDQAYKDSVSQYTDARDALATAKGELTCAQTTYDTAKAALDATPQTLPDGSANPAYTAAKNACDQATQNLEAKKQDVANKEKDLEAKETAMKEAKGKASQAEADKNRAEEDLDKKQKLLDKLNEELPVKKKAVEDAEKAKQKAEDELKAANAEVETAEGAIKKYEQAVKDKQAMADNIAAQEKRLAEMKQAEQKEIDALKAKNEELDSRIDYSDGVNTTREKVAWNKMQKNKGKIATLSSHEYNIMAQDRGIAFDAITDINGTTFNITSNGKYQVNGQDVDLSKFDEELKKAKAAKPSQDG